MVYVGTYSEVLGHVPYGKGRGIELFEFDTESGSLSTLSVQVIPSFHTLPPSLHPHVTIPILY